MQSFYFTVKIMFCARLGDGEGVCSQSVPDNPHQNQCEASLLMVSVQLLKHTLHSGSREHKARLRFGTGSSSLLCCSSVSSGFTSSSSTISTSLNSSTRSCVRDLHTSHTLSIGYLECVATLSKMHNKLHSL